MEECKFKVKLFFLVISLLLCVGGPVEAAKSTTANLYKEAVSLNKKGKIYRASYKFSQFIDLADLNNDATNDMLITAASVLGGTDKLYQVGRALDKVDEAKLKKPEMICAYYKMKALLAQNVYDDEGAVSNADKVITVKNKKCNSDIAVAHFIKGNILDKQGDSDGSMVEWSLGMKMSAKNVDYNNLGLIFNNFDKVLLNYKKTPFGLVHTGDLYYAKGLNEQAKKNYLAAIKQDKDFLPAYMSLGELYSSTDDATNTMKYYKLAVNIDPEYYRALNGVGFAYFIGFNVDNITKEELPAAIDYLNRSLNEDPTYYRAYNNLGLIYKNLGQIDLAEKNFNLAISSSQQAQTVGYWKPYLNMGSLRAEQNDYEVASKYYLKAVEVAPDDRFVNSILGGFFYDNEKYVQAIIFYTKAVQLGTKDLGALEQFAHSYYMLNQLNEAKTLAEQILLIYPNSKGITLLLADIYGEMGLTKEADEMKTKAEILPNEN